MKIFRKILIFLSVFIMLFCFSGCDALDEAREKQGYYGESMWNISYKGNVYKMLDRCDTLFPEYENDLIFITKKDVPVLLSAFLGDKFLVSEDEVFIAENYGSYEVFCRADKFEEINGRIKNLEELTEYAVYYTSYDDETEDFENKWLPFSDELSAEFDYLLANGKVEAMMEINYNYLFDVMLTSEDRLFCQNAFSLVNINGNYSMVGESAEGLLKIGIPAEYNEEIEDMLKIYSEETDINLEFGNGFNPQYSY